MMLRIWSGCHIQKEPPQTPSLFDGQEHTTRSAGGDCDMPK
jgi:hypothetical protein